MIFNQKPVSHHLGGLRGRGHKVKIQLFQNTVMLKRVQMQQHDGSKCFACRPPPSPPPPPRPWSVGQNLTFSEHGHVAYQIKENHECSNMVVNILANILPADPYRLPPPPPPPPPPPDHWDGVIRSKFKFFSLGCSNAILKVDLDIVKPYI